MQLCTFTGLEEDLYMYSNTKGLIWFRYTEHLLANSLHQGAYRKTPYIIRKKFWSQLVSFTFLNSERGNLYNYYSRMWSKIFGLNMYIILRSSTAVSGF